MPKNVSVLSASPRKGGNSDLLCDQFVLGAKEAGHQVEKLFLRDKRIIAEVIVMATPVYFYNMNGQLKTLIDRTCARCTEIGNKAMYFIMTAAVTRKDLLQTTLESFRGFTSCLNGAKERGVIYGTGAWKKGDIKGSAAMTQAYEMGKKA